MLDIAPAAPSDPAALATEKRKRKVAVVGTAPSGRHAPYDDPSWEIWGVAARAPYVTRATRWYEVHDLDNGKWGDTWAPKMAEWVKDCECWMFYPHALLPDAKFVPTRELIEIYDPFFLSSSMAWMMAHAIEAERFGEAPVGEIGIWGVDMEFGTEYYEQRAGIRHFIEIARHRNINVRRLRTGGVTYEPLPYPFCHDDPLAEKLALRREKIVQEQKTQQALLDAARARIQALDGGIAALAQSGLDVTKLQEEKAIVERSIPTFLSILAELRGALKDNEWTANFIRP